MRGEVLSAQQTAGQNRTYPPSLSFRRAGRLVAGNPLLGQESTGRLPHHIVVLLLELGQLLLQLGGQFRLGLQLLDFAQPLGEILLLLDQRSAEAARFGHAAFCFGEVGTQCTFCLFGRDISLLGERALVQVGKAVWMARASTERHGRRVQSKGPLNAGQPMPRCRRHRAAIGLRSHLTPAGSGEPRPSSRDRADCVNGVELLRIVFAAGTRTCPACCCSRRLVQRCGGGSGNEPESRLAGDGGGGTMEETQNKERANEEERETKK